MPTPRWPSPGPPRRSSSRFAAAERGFTAVKHQREVGTGYFDEVTQVIQGGQSSVTALTGSTEEAQFDAHPTPIDTRRREAAGAAE